MDKNIFLKKNNFEQASSDDKISLSELKKVVKAHKKSVPMLSSGKNTLLAYAAKHQLLDAKEHLNAEKVHEKLAVKERKIVEKDVKKAVKKLEKVEVKAVKKPMVHNLQEVQKIRKEKGVSLKEAWAIHLKKT